MMKLLIASRNPHKLEEIKAIFSSEHLELLSPDDLPGLPEVEEDGDTLEANAVKKAATLAKKAGMWALADDTGLEVSALNGAPGVYSARYAGEDVSYEDNNTKLLSELEGKDDRSARFRSVIALASPSGEAHTVDGICPGRIAEERSGTEGFGYDPLFIPEGEQRSFAEMSAEEKNTISHRARSLGEAKKAWADFLASEPSGW